MNPTGGAWSDPPNWRKYTVYASATWMAFLAGMMWVTAPLHVSFPEPMGKVVRVAALYAPFAHAPLISTCSARPAARLWYGAAEGWQAARGPLVLHASVDAA